MSPQAMAERDAAVADVDREERRNDEEVCIISGQALASGLLLSLPMWALIGWVLRVFI